MTTEGQIWWEAYEGVPLRQGQLLPHCFVPIIPANYARDGVPQDGDLEFEERELIVLTQSCDLVSQGEGRSPRAESVALCAVYTIPEFELTNEWFKSRDAKNQVRLGRREGFYLLSSVTERPQSERSLIADFHNVFSLPRLYLEAQARRSAPCWTLRSPLLEHFSQAFGYFFMRVGLPDAAVIPRFT
jgi:hypothetical protein